MAAAQAAFPGWRATPMAERVRLLKRVAALIEERVYDIAAALTLEVGKNRMEALGEPRRQRISSISTPMIMPHITVRSSSAR